MTTCEISSAEHCTECLHWRIEDWHRILKTGCRIEHLAHKTAVRLERAIVINLVIAWRIMLMTLLGREAPDLPAEVLLSEKAAWNDAPCTAGRRRADPMRRPHSGGGIDRLEFGHQIGRASHERAPDAWPAHLPLSLHGWVVVERDCGLDERQTSGRLQLAIPYPRSGGGVLARPRLMPRSPLCWRALGGGPPMEIHAGDRDSKNCCSGCPWICHFLQAICHPTVYESVNFILDIRAV